MGLPEARVVNPYVFIVGCARSGTTLLERMVDAHPEIAITHQWHGIPQVFERRKGMTAEGLVRPKLISMQQLSPRAWNSIPNVGPAASGTASARVLTLAPPRPASPIRQGEQRSCRRGSRSSPIEV